jgi:Zn-finger nucleic acid-binding protein
MKGRDGGTIWDVMTGPNAPTGTTTTTGCPRCEEPLVIVEVGGQSLRSCPKCKGSLLLQTQLPRVLEAMSGALAREFNPDAQLAAIADRGPGVRCPVCANDMGHDDYCSARLVFFDRCAGCGAIWLDADELGTMSLMWARMDARQARAHAEAENTLAQASGFVDGVLMARAVSGILFGRVSGISVLAVNLLDL